MTQEQTQSKYNTNNKPSHTAYRVDGSGQRANWTKIGAMWPNKDGQGFNLVLKGIDRDIQVVLRESKQQYLMSWRHQ